MYVVDRSAIEEGTNPFLSEYYDCIVGDYKRDSEILSEKLESFILITAKAKGGNETITIQ